MTEVKTQQSPIEINPSATVPTAYGKWHLRFRYSQPIHGKYEGENFIVDPPAKDATPWTLTLGREDWHLRKIHIHDHVEHRLTGATNTHFECHLVHSLPADTGATGELLVVGVFFREDKGAKRKASLERFNLNLKANRKADGSGCDGLTGEINPAELIPNPNEDPDAYNARARWFHYMGSLTTPGFDERVRWFVIKDEIPVHPDDLGEIRRCACHKARDVQDLNRRFILRNVFDVKEAESSPVA